MQKLQVIHLEITNKCNLRCHFCYINRNSKEIKRKRFAELIGHIQEYTKQVTLGGGEPLLHRELPCLLRVLKNAKLPFSITTNATQLSPYDSLLVNPFLKSVCLSFYGKRNKDAIEYFLEKVNLKGTKYPEIVISVLPEGLVYTECLEFIELCKRYEFSILLLKRKYKHRLPKIIEQRIVGGLFLLSAFLRDELKRKVYLDSLLAGQCLALDKFVTIDVDGNVFQCSFVRNSLGNIFEEKLKDIISKSKKVKCPYTSLKVN